MATVYRVKKGEPLPATIMQDGIEVTPEWIDVSTRDDWAKGDRVFIPGLVEAVADPIDDSNGTIEG